MTQTLDIALPGTSGGWDGYLARVNAMPMLSAEEEHALAVRFRDEGDIDAARRLVLSHLRFVVKVARGYQGYGLSQHDLVQEGTIGLMKAVKRFDPDVGVRLVSFAVHWIRAEIHEYIIRNWRIVKVATTKAQRKLFFNLRSSKKRLGWLNRQVVEEVAVDLGVRSEDVLNMESPMAALDESFDGPDDDDMSFAPARALPDPAATPEAAWEHERSENERDARLHEALSSLDERSRTILTRRWLQDDDRATLQALAGDFGVSAERIRQIEKAALKKLRENLADVAV